jgi:hypothetical protein
MDYDVDIEVMELPYAFRTTLATIPREVPYLTAEPLPFADDGPRAGLVWRAGDWNERRSIEFSLVRTLFDDQRLSWYSLQLERGSQDCDPRLRSLDVRSVAATARAISAMNLVISVDTMPAHLAGALGMPVWTLLPHDADWRWMEARSDSPWYPTMRLFRQPSPGDWHSVIQKVRRALANLGPTAGLGMPSLR